MGIIKKQITIIRLIKPKHISINEELQWLGNSLGLFHLRDKDKSCFRLFVEFVKAAKINQSLSSDELADRTNLSRGTVVHHLNKMLESGLILQEHKKYILRDYMLERLIEDVKKDLDQTFEDLKKTARELDVILRI
ncbi:helix-turn-helix transcriptional regulator [Candidatus Woesearchaeota archaeon]|nr:helix-turn-helix transcriptional regulator [Candidatus Woesearchaeota archaeon]